jgi:hypothetical protein
VVVADRDGERRDSGETAFAVIVLELRAFACLLAPGTRLGAKCASASIVGGSRQNMIASPRMTCGQNMAAKSVSGVCSPLRPRPASNSPNPRDVSSRALTRCSSATAIGSVKSRVTPVTNIVTPISKALWQSHER